jgi:Tol biopolymer transport system component
MMPLPSRTRVGPYEITAQIGAGGMGEVYRARDTRLNREVALKILPEAFAADPDRLARFTREAQLLASLNHPNIAGIYGLEEADGLRALVLELVEGPTLAERVARGALPVDEALPIARQMAAALEAAHEHGIVHRDLKPANVKVTPDGVVKVLDFGLAKLTGPAEAGHYVPDRGVRLQPDLTASPTITTPGMVTGVGIILGTAAYMAPEQAKGRPADKRADVWAFGCVLYEMLTGRAPFAGEDVSDTLANVLKREPDWSALPADIPPAIHSLLRRCLEKDRRKRVSDIAAAIFALHEAQRLGDGPPAGAVARSSRLQRFGIPVVTLALGAGLAVAATYFERVPVEAPELRLHMVTPPTDAVAGAVAFAVSPDGQSVVFRALVDQVPHLWLRRLSDETARPLPGTERGTLPFWSPDGRSIGFWADQRLKRVDVAGGSIQEIAAATSPYGASWSTDAVIVFSGSNTAPLYRVPAAGDQKPIEATRLGSGHVAHRFPFFLPDGRRFLFFATGSSDVQGVYIGSLDSSESTRLVEADTKAVFMPPDVVLYGRTGALYAQRVDRDASPVGEPMLVAERLAQNPGTFASAAISASSIGTFAYRSAAEDAGRELRWVGRAGQQDAPVSITGLEFFSDLSPDGRTIAVSRTFSGNTDIWLIETARGVLRRFTFDPADDSTPRWSPDGSRVAFQAQRKGGGLFDLFVKSLSEKTEQVLLESSENKNMSDWSRDGRFILYTSQSPKSARDIWALPLEGDRKPFVVVQSPFEETLPRFSPDGRWVSYQSSETGRVEIHVQPFPGPARSWQISTNGGTNAQWRSDGREMFYVAPDNRLMAVPVTLNAAVPAVDAGNPSPLFSVRAGANYSVVTPDGQRFLVNTPTDDASVSPITIVLNWKPPAR